ncbi:MAG: LysM peptidoglycan-binding domain-containing protein, partial [Oscillospiraceae bacterium]|nr:LysM peptidoglycan-binding domain-containing protein [Oscillospiraceae bacterium]
GGTPFSVERRVEVSSIADIPENCTATIEDVCCGELRAAAAGGGIEVRFSAVFTLMLTCRFHTVTLCALQVQPRSEEQEKAPSLVLKPLLKGQRLWDIAKQYRTTCEDILCANEAEDESAFSVGEMLLIPKRR